MDVHADLRSPDVASLGTILGVWAHPDDEAYLMGGLMALAVDAGQHVACVTATCGEAGESADPERWPPERLAEIRRAELADSLALLGVTDHEWLGHPDGGLAQVDPAVGAAQVAAAMERVRPDTVMTFGSDGMTGHPDHRTVGAWTTAAFAAYTARTSPGSRLLLATKSETWAREFPDADGSIFPEGPPSTPDGDLAVALRLDGPTLERKVRALEAQASQTSGVIAAMGRGELARWVADEHWVGAPTSPGPATAAAGQSARPATGT